MRVIKRLMEDIDSVVTQVRVAARITWSHNLWAWGMHMRWPADHSAHASWVFTPVPWLQHDGWCSCLSYPLYCFAYTAGCSNAYR